MFDIQSSDLLLSDGSVPHLQLGECLTRELKERRETLAREWPSLRSQIPPPLAAEFIPRGKTELPDDFCAWAPGIAIAGADLLRAAHAKTPDPEGWVLTNFDVFRKPMPRNTLTVRRSGRFWTVERVEDYVLSIIHGPLPIFTRDAIEAMQLAEYCHLPATSDEPYGARPRGAAAGLCWAVCTPDGFRYRYL